MGHVAADGKGLWDCLGALSVFSPLGPGSRSGEEAACCALVHGPSLQSRAGSSGVKNEERLKSGLNNGMLEVSLAETCRNGHFLLVLS